MKNVVLSSPAVDAKALRAMLVIEALIVAVIVVYISPTPLENVSGRLLNSVLSFGMAILTWMCFRLLEPKRCGQGWLLTRLVCIPCFWLLVFFAVVAWIQHNQAVFMNELDEALSLFKRVIL